MLVGLGLLAWSAIMLPVGAQEATLEKPANIVCRHAGNADIDESVRVTWDDESENETGYEVHRSVEGGDFEKLADLGDDETRYTDSDVVGDEDSQPLRYRVRAMDGDQPGPWSDACRRPKTLDTAEGNFRVYHRPYDEDDAPPFVYDKDDDKDRKMHVPSTTTSEGANEVAARIGRLLEGSRHALIEEVGFEDPSFFREEKPVPVDITGAVGAGKAWMSSPGKSGWSRIWLEAGFVDDPHDASDPKAGENVGSVGTTLHEHFHHQQFFYGGVYDAPASDWVMEGQARSIEDKVCIGTDRSSCISLDEHQGYPGGYAGAARGFLRDNKEKRLGLTQRSYRGALFWTYVLEQYGDLDQEPERGVDFLRDFWEQARNERHDTGIGTLNRTLEAQGESDRFADVFQNFVVANYAKDLDPSSVPDTYRYKDQEQSPYQYERVRRDVDVALGAGEQVGPNLDHVSSWGARYYQVRPDEAVGTLRVEAHQDASNNPAFYAVLGVEDNQLTLERSGSGSDFVESFDNPGYDRVVLIVAGLRQDLNFRWAINAEEPVMDIVEPVTGRRAQAGDPGDPGKFLTKVDVLEPDGDPVAGIAPESFTVTVGSETVTDDEMVSRSVVQGQYWLLVQAPEQDSAGRYDLTVEAAGLSDTEVDAVSYGPRSNVDTELVIDRSGSMGDHDKLASAKTAGTVYVDTWPSSDLAGLVSFNASATVDEPLAPLGDQHREKLHGAIDELTSDGQTAIGEGVLTALDDLGTNGNEDHDWAAVVLSDGKETADDARDISDVLDTYEQRQDDGDPVPEVHAVALGPDADRAAMQRLANETGGTYQFAAVPDSSTSGTATTAAAGEPDALTVRLPAIYRVVSEEVAGEQQVFAGNGDTIFGPNHTFSVDGGAEELTVAMSTEGRDSYDATLIDPSNNIHGPARDFFDHTFWRVDNPEPGDWRLNIEPVGPEPFSQSYQADAAVTSQLTMEAFLGLAPDERLAGQAMPILVSLSDTGPITGASVDVKVTAPDGTSSTLELFDDGEHGDGEAGDGFYGTAYRATHAEGDYVATISAEGSSGAFGDFSRRARTSFGMSAGADSDGDSLPDWWEEEHGTDPETADASDDPDGDVLSNTEEWEIGTHPLDPDTDSGGELDGTDPDPLDPTDDRLLTPDAQAYAGVGEVLVRYSHSDHYTSVRVERAPDPQGPFTAIADGVSATGEHTDTEVTNGDEVCYRVRGLGGGAESGYSPARCAVPRTDPIPPQGRVLIDGDAPTTADRDVELELAADDNPEPHLDHPGAAPHPDDAEESGVAEVRIGNEGDLSDADWESFAETRAWTLPDQPGPATVYVQYRDAAGNTSDVVTDTIELVDDGDGERTTRHGGPTRVETAREISRNTHDQADTVVVARADEYADALAGAPLATHLGGPVLLTGGGQLHPVTADEIERLGASEAVLLGGQAALSAQVADDVADLGVDVRRLGGTDRFDTARLVADELPDADEVYVAEGIHTDPGRGWPDAMSAAGAAAGQQAPVLLVAHGLVPEATSQALASGQDVAIVGGTAAVSAEVADTLDAQAGAVRRLSGSTRYDTSAEVADDAVSAGADPATTWVATGRDWADALVSAAATGHASGSLVMIDGQNLDFSPASRDWIADHADQIATLNLAGGTVAISADTADALADLLVP